MDYDYDPVPLASKAQLTSAEGLERSSQYLETMQQPANSASVF